MGGHALKKVETSRIDLNTYSNIKLDLKSKFENKLCMEFLIDVPNKTDFGDIDVLYLDNRSNAKIDIYQLVKQTFNPVEIVVNDVVCSFSYPIILNNETKYFQVDMIACVNLEMSRFYFSYGDLGGILGRVAQHIGLKFGSIGLWICPKSETIGRFLDLEENLDYKNNLLNKLTSNDFEMSSITNAQYTDIILTTNPKIICEYFGLDWTTWTIGFSSMDKIFEWICTSKYFNAIIFKVLSYEHRHRANKRPMYQEFLQYISKKYLVNEIGEEFTIEKIEKADSVNYININLQLETLEYFNKFELLKNSINTIYDDFIRKKKFNGKKFLNLGIINKEINIYTREFKKKIEVENGLEFTNWLDNNDYETIDLAISDFVTKHNK